MDKMDVTDAEMTLGEDVGVGVKIVSLQLRNGVSFCGEWANNHRTRNFEGMYTLLVPMSSDWRHYMRWRDY